jgi:hypothetical protein
MSKPSHDKDIGGKTPSEVLLRVNDTRRQGRKYERILCGCTGQQ